jgi:PilZ domain
MISSALCACHVVNLFALQALMTAQRGLFFGQTKSSRKVPEPICPSHSGLTTLSNVIFMDDRTTKGQSTKTGVRDRRYAIRFPFAADVNLIDMESGTRSDGVTSDLSLGGCFVCTSRPLPVGTRIRIALTRKNQTVEALAVVRIWKPRIGMGIEFIDVEGTHQDVLCRWIDQVRQNR